MFCKRPGVARPFLCLVAFLAASRIPVTLSVERLSGWRKLAPNLKERHNLNMADEPENMTLILLREIRGEQERLSLPACSASWQKCASKRSSSRRSPGMFQSLSARFPIFKSP